METKEKFKFKFCLGEVTLKEIIVLAIFVGTMLSNVVVGYYQSKDLPEKVNKNSVEIANLKNETTGIKSDIKNIDKTTQTILKHILRKK